MQTFYIDGSCISTLEEFAVHFSDKVLGGHKWNGNLDALDDILYGGFGTPEEGFRLVWMHSKRSADVLGYPETLRQLRLKLQRADPSNRKVIATRIAAAERGIGPTIFTQLVSVLQSHGSAAVDVTAPIHLELR